MIINFCARSCSFKRRQQPEVLRLDLFISFKRKNYKSQAGNFSSLRLTLERAGTVGEGKIPSQIEA